MKIAAEPESGTVSAQSKKILTNHLNAFFDNDLERIVSDYTEESVLITKEKIYSGRGEIRNFFAELIADFPKGKSVFDLDKLTAHGQLAFIVWHAKTPSLEVPFATDTFIFKNGKIHQQTFAGQLQSLK